MRRKYSIALAGVLLAGAAAAAPCPTAITQIAGRVAQLRQVPPPFAPPCRLITSSELRGVLDRKLRRDLPVAPELFIQALFRLGFIEDDSRSVYDHILTFYTTQVLGFYEPETDEMIVVDSPAASRVEGALVWAHELEHAAQEHRFHLPSRLLAIRGDSDQQRAASAIAEGEAMLVMFLLNSPGSGAEQLSAAESTVATQARALAPNPEVPAYFVADLVFPYTAGFSAALRAYRSGGWEAVDGLLAHPPASTSALLHPDRPAAAGSVPARELPPPCVLNNKEIARGSPHRLGWGVGSGLPSRQAHRDQSGRRRRLRVGRRPAPADTKSLPLRQLGAGLAAALSHRSGAAGTIRGVAAIPPARDGAPDARRPASAHLGCFGADP